jgi:hypothetical protein
MKTVVSILLFFILSSSVHSQINKGQWIVGGTADFSHSHASSTTNMVSSDNKITNLESSPGGGYFFMDQLCAGIRVGVTTSKSKQIIDGRSNPLLSNYYSAESKITGLAFSPFVRYYLLAPSRKLNVFADASYAYNHNKIKTETYQEFTVPGNQFPTITSSTSDNKYKTHSYSIAAGPALFLNPKVSLELTLGYTFSKYEDSDQSANTFVLGAGFQVHLGKSK